MKPLVELKPLVYSDYLAYTEQHNRDAYHELSGEWQWHYVYLQALVEGNQTLSKQDAQQLVNELIQAEANKPKASMTWAQYKELALKTEAIPDISYASITNRHNFESNSAYIDEKARATRLMHAAAGLDTETDELINFANEQNLLEELGDCFWYLPIIEQCLDITFEPRSGAFTQDVSGYDVLQDMAMHASCLIDQCIKRHLIYGKPLDAGIVKAHTQHYVDGIYTYLNINFIRPSEVWEANIIKLKKRYPDGRFDVVATSNRDVENELSHIPGNKTVVPTVVSDDPVGQVIAEDTAVTKPTARQLWFDATPCYGAQIDKFTFKGLLGNVGPFDTAVQMVAEWARNLANAAVSQGADCIAEGYKTAYNKIMANSKPNDKFHMEAWYIFNLIPGAPIAVEEVEAWLSTQH